MLRPLLILAFLGAVLVPSTARPPSAWADTTADAGAEPFKDPPVVVPAPAPLSGSGATVEQPKPSDAIHNPASEPVAAWDDVKAARKTSWPLAVWAVLAMLGKALAYGSDKLKRVPVLGKLAAWLATGKRAMVVAGIGAVGSAGYDVLVAGGSLVAALIASGIAIAGTTHSTTQPKQPAA